MKDYQTHVEKLRKDAAECALVRDLATDKGKLRCSTGWRGIWIS